MEKDNSAIIRPAEETDYPAILAIVNELPEWFDEDARNRAIPVDIQHQTVLVAQKHKAIAGFVSWFVYEGRLHIGWLGVRPGLQRRGIGGRMIRQLCAEAAERSISEIAVTTLGDHVEYEPYDRTRSFYRKNNFVISQRKQTNNPGCPEEIVMIRKL